MKQVFIGYAPGGDCHHGVARVTVEGRDIVSAETDHRASISDALDWFQSSPIQPTAVGIDGPTAWGSDFSGYRPADLYLAQSYPRISESILAVNSMRGAKVANGVSLLLQLRHELPALLATETNSKALFFALAGESFKFTLQNVRINHLADWLTDGAAKLVLASDAEWCALTSAYAAYKGTVGDWRLDLHLHELRANPSFGGPIRCGKDFVHPAGRTSFYWPGEVKDVKEVFKCCESHLRPVIFRATRRAGAIS